MNKAIKKFIRDCLRLLFIFSVPWFLGFLPNSTIIEEGFLLWLLILFIVFSLFVLNSSLELVKEIGKENIYSLFYAVPISAFYLVFAYFISGVASDRSSYLLYSYSSRQWVFNFRYFLNTAQETGLMHLIIYFIIMFIVYCKLRD